MCVKLEPIQIDKFQIDCMIRSLALYVQMSGWRFDQVVGIERGGLHVSVPVAKILGIPHTSVRISCYDDTGRRDTPIVSGAYNSDLASLVVDDLTDGGTTLRLFKERFPYKRSDATAVLFWNTTAPEPDFYVEEKPENWLIFSWENE
jgi:hypoxanthine phosphoribosyltransferase